MKELLKACEIVANVVVFGGILLLLWVMVGALLGGVWAVATRVHGVLS